MRKIEKIEKCQRTSKSTLNKNRGRMESMLKYKSEQGITLVALVITVIIIIILSTVTINMAFGDNGLITQAQKAKDMTANSIVAEQEGMNSVMSEYLNVMGEDIEIPVPEPPDIPGGNEATVTGAIAFTNPTWTSGQASVTISTNTSYAIQYQVVANEGASNNVNWQAVPAGGIINNLNHRDVVYARLVQGTNYGEEASTTIKDENPPTISNIATSNITTSSISVTVTATDNETGIENYVFTINGGSQASSPTGSHTFTGLNASTQYTIQVTVTDKAGQTVQDSAQATTKQTTVADAIENGTEFGTTTEIKDASGDSVWIPGGFEIASDSATDADDGIVITNSNNTKQFVWIPVDETSLGEMYNTKGGEKTLLGVDTKTSIYSNLRVRSGETSSWTPTEPGQTSGIREPDVLSSYDTSSRYYQDILGYASTKDMADAMVAEYAATYASIEQYDGFYIGRYELTGSVDVPTVQKGQTVLTADIAVNWYYLKKACTNVVTGDEYGAQSTMIYGNQWDEVMDWLVDTGMSSDLVNKDSSSWGNYNNSSGAAATNSGSKRASGYNEAWQANNIYDLAGNCWEWTQEAHYTDGRVGRGGGYDGSGSLNPASDRNYSGPSYNGGYVSSRVALYIK